MTIENFEDLEVSPEFRYEEGRLRRGLGDFKVASAFDIADRRGLDTPVASLWVDGISGSDRAVGSVGAPLATLDEALKRVGDVRVSTTIRLETPSPLANGYTAKELTYSRAYLAGLNIIGNTAYDVVVTTKTVASATFQSITPSGGGMTVNAYKGCSVKVLDGPQAGITVRILRNSTTVITLMNGFPANLLAGTTFQIYYPGINIDLTNLTACMSDNYLIYPTFTNVEWVISTTTTTIRGFFRPLGVSVVAGSAEKTLNVIEGGFIGEPVMGFAWRKTGSLDYGNIRVSASPFGTWTGVLGRISFNGCNGRGHSSGQRFAGGEAQWVAEESKTSVFSTVWEQGQSAVCYAHDYGSLLGPFRLSGGFCEVSSGLYVDKSDGSAGNMMLREQAMLELASQILFAHTLDLDHSSKVRQGGSSELDLFEDIVVDGRSLLNNLHEHHSYGFEGSRDSRVWSAISPSTKTGDFWSTVHRYTIAPVATARNASVANAGTITIDYKPVQYDVDLLIELTYTIRVNDHIFRYYVLVKFLGNSTYAITITGHGDITPTYSGKPSITMVPTIVSVSGEDHVRMTVTNSTGSAKDIRISYKVDWEKYA